MKCNENAETGIAKAFSAAADPTGVAGMITIFTLLPTSSVFSILKINHHYRRSMYLYIPIVFFIIVNIIQHRRRRIITKFYDADALTPSTAKPFSEVDVAEGIVTMLMLKRGVLRTTENGRYFISLSRIEELDRKSLTRLKYIGGTLLLLLLITGIYWMLR